MEALLLWAYLIVAAAAIVESLLLGLQTWEHRRFVRSSFRTAERHHPTGRAAVFAPCKGFDVGLEENLRALFRQDYPDYELTFIVESADDPACAVIRRAMAGHRRVAARLLVAGRADDCGQKVHNLLAATASLAPGIRYLAFVDSDARPRPEWLRLLLARLDRPNLGAASGYRWFVPARPSPANWLLCSINGMVAVMLGGHRDCWVWGGSWAVSRDCFEQLGVREAWRGTLSDDLVVSRLLTDAVRHSRFEPLAMVASPIDFSFGTMFSFLRRQYLVGRYYAFRYWLLALAGACLVNLAWAGHAAMLAWSLLGGPLTPWVPLGLGGALYAMGAYRGLLRQSVCGTYLPEHWRQLRAARWFDILAGPLVGAVNLLGLLSAAVGRRIRWRGISYRMRRGGQIAGLERDAGPPPAVYFFQAAERKAG